MKDISTTNKEEFFKSEMKHFGKRSLERFIKYMKNMDATCNSCGTYYWKGCKKRCNCN